MQQFLTNHDSTKSVIVILQLAKLKKYFGKYSIFILPAIYPGY